MIRSLLFALSVLCFFSSLSVAHSATSPSSLTIDIKSASDSLIYGLYPVSTRPDESTKDQPASEQMVLRQWQMTKLSAEADAGKPDWIDVTMPASVHYALLKAGKIDNPWFGRNYDQLQWIQDTDWLLKTTFTVPANWKGKVVRLRFDGMDYLGSIWLDDGYVGSHAGMFGGPTLDITALAKPGSTHMLTVRLLHGLEDAETMKARVQLGNRSWGNMYRTVGLWQPVRLVATGKAYMEAPNVRTDSINGGSATLFGQTMILNTGADFQGKVKARIIDLTTHKSVWQKDYPQRIRKGTSFWEQTITLKNPRLWWPNGMGAQSLYRLELQLSGDSTQLDAISSKFGVRTIDVVRNPYVPNKPRFNHLRPDVWSLDVKPAPELGNSVLWGRPDLWSADNAVDDDSLHNSDESYRYLFVVNGRPLYGKGVCWMVPDDVLALDAEREKWLVGAAKNAGINIFRLNGGNSLLDTDRFYDRCDENGILVWQDLPFCWHREIKIPLTVWREQLKQSVLRLRQHPSLAIWVGGNEFSPYATGLINYMGIAREVIASYDNRQWRMNSPSAGTHHSYFAHGQFNEQAFHDLWIGDPNSYIRDFAEDVAFVSEWSMMSFTNTSQLKRTIPAEELGDQPVGYDCKAYVDARPTLHARIVECDRMSTILWSKPSSFGDLGKATIPEMVEYSQMAHAETYGYVFENWRAQFPYKGGETVWTYNSHSPLSDWSIIDWFGQPKVTFYSVKRANEPIHVYANTGYMSWGAGDTLTAEVAAINDKFTPLEGAKLKARLLDADMKPVLAKTWKTNVPAGGYHSKLNKISWPIPKGTPAGFVFLETTLDSSSGEQLSRNVYCLRIAAALADPKARAAWKATPTEEVLNTKGPFLRTQVEKHPTTLHSEILNIKDQGKQAVVRVRIQNTGKKPAYPVRLTLTPDSNSVLWSDNYFWLKPGETRIIEGIVRLDMAGIDLLTKTSKVPISDLKLTVSSWNTPAGKALVAAVR